MAAITDQQYEALVADILAAPDMDAYIASGQDNAIRAAYNASGSFVVWRSSVLPDEYRQALVWTEVDGLTAGKARIWEWLTSGMMLPLDPSRLAVRQGLADCWASNTQTRPALMAIAKRFATRAERLFATGPGTDADPGLLTWEGDLTDSDIARALRG